MSNRLRRATISMALLAAMPAANAQITEIVDSSGGGPGAPLDKPAGIGVDGLGNVFVTGATTNNVLMITPAGTITEIIGAAGDGSGSGLSSARGLAVGPDGTVFVSGWASNNVFMITSPGQPTQTIKKVMDSTGDGTHAIGRPSEMVVDALGNLYVSGIDTDNVFVVRSPGTGAQTTAEIMGPAGDGAGNPLDLPGDLAVDAAGNLYVPGGNSDNLFQIASPGLPGQVIIEIVDASGDGSGKLLDHPRGVAVDASGTVYVAGEGSDNVLRVTNPGLPSQAVSQIIDGSGAGPGSALDGANYLAVDSVGTVYVTGVHSDNAFQILSPGLTNAVTETIDASGDGLGNPLHIGTTVAVNVVGDVFVVGQGSDNVFRIQIAAPSFIAYGSGCPGTGGVVPVLAMSGAATPGGSVQLDIQNGVGSGTAFIFMGLQQASTHMGFGCTLNVAPLLPAIVGPIPLFPFGAQGAGAGSISIPTALPASIVTPLTLALQGFINDTGGKGGFANTNGVQIDIH